MDELFNVYAMLRADGAIVGIEGGLTEGNIRDLSLWTLIDSGEGTRYARCQAEYLPGGLRDADGIPMYKYVDDAVLPRSEAEKAADKLADEKMDADADLLEDAAGNRYRPIVDNGTLRLELVEAADGSCRY